MLYSDVFDRKGYLGLLSVVFFGFAVYYCVLFHHKSFFLRFLCRFPAWFRGRFELFLVVHRNSHIHFLPPCFAVFCPPISQSFFSFVFFAPAYVCVASWQFCAYSRLCLTVSHFFASHIFYFRVIFLVSRVFTICSAIIKPPSLAVP
jgi:hypothetical protein